MGRRSFPPTFMTFGLGLPEFLVAPGPPSAWRISAELPASDRSFFKWTAYYVEKQSDERKPLQYCDRVF